MTCRRVRDELRLAAGRDVPAAARAHLESCASCAAEARALSLLRLGSARDEEATLRPGFEERLGARLLSEAPAAAPSPWNGGFDRLVRPALAAAAALALVCAGLFAQVASPPGGGDLSALLETDPVFASILTTNPDAIFTGTQVPAAAETP